VLRIRNAYPGSRIRIFSSRIQGQKDLIRDVHPGPGYWILISVGDPGCLSRIPDPSFFHPGSRIQTVSIPDPGSRIRIKEFKYFNPKKNKKLFLSSRKYDPGCSSQIPDPDADFLPIPDPEVKKAPDPGSGSATLIRILIFFTHPGS
jgi:hypothetical protein